MIFEEFAPTTAQRLDALKALRGQVLLLISAGGATCWLMYSVLVG
jgi:hypothetical protein